MSKHRSFTPEFKAQIVLEVLTGTRSAAEVCREHQLKETVFYRWKEAFLQNASKAFQPAALAPELAARLSVELHIGVHPMHSMRRERQ